VSDLLNNIKTANSRQTGWSVPTRAWCKITAII